MKNKKLFAILTLVCFMFTLMPVVAFAAPAVTNSVYVSADDTTYSDEATVAPGAFYVKAAATTSAAYEAGYVFYAVDGDGNGVAVDNTNQLTINVPGEYKVYAAVIGTADITTLLGSVDTVANKVAKVEAWAESNYRVVDEYATVSVEAPEYTYKITLAEYTKDGYGNGSWADNSTATEQKYTLGIEASNGFEKDGKVVATVQKYDGSAWTAVKGQDVTISEAGYVDVDYDTLTTDKKGQVVFNVTSTLANTGNKVIVKYDDAVATLTVNASATAVTKVSLNNEPKAPQNKDNAVLKANVEFAFADANGVATDVADLSTVVLSVVEKPANSTLKDSDLKLIKQAANAAQYIKADATGVYTLDTKVADKKFDKEGTYVIKAAMKNGASATATVKVAKMGDTVGIMFAQAPKTVAYGEMVPMGPVMAVDAKGVVEPIMSGLELSASGLAVESFTGGNLTAKADDDYVGQTITVMAVYGDFVATTDVVVVDQAATIKLVSTEAEVGINTKLVGRIVDATGKSTTIDETTVTVKAIVLDKPENAVAVATPANPAGLVEHNAIINFLASAPGEYKVQTIVTYTLPGADNNYATPADNVVKYISGIETITVGGGINTFDDVVVVSLGAGSMIVNNEVVKLDVAPFIENNRTMMQFNVLYVFGIDVQWVAETQSIVAEGNGLKVVMQLGSKVATVNGAEVALDVAPYSVNGRTVVPVGFITGLLDITPTFTYNADGTIADILFTK